jgi:molybdate transport system substrate-binding protein
VSRNFGRTLLALPCVLVIIAMTSGCQSQAESTHELTVFAASSLTDALTEIGQTFEAHNPGVKVIFNFASSSDLALQLTEGAKADVFASANQKQMDNVDKAGLLEARPDTFATNRLVVIIPADNPALIQAPVDLQKEGIKLVLAAPDVPVRDYAEQVLDKLSADPAYGEGFKTAVLANLVSEEANVRQVVTKVALGEADAGIVYTSDVTPDVAGKLLRIDIPDASNIVAIYPIAIIRDAPGLETARSFVAFVLSQDGQAILKKWGFGSVDR